LNKSNYDKIFKSMGRDKTILEGHKNRIESLVLLPDGTMLSADYNILKFWNPDDCQCIGTVEEGVDVDINSVILLPEWKLATCSRSV
jgi:hypothetical protein